MEIKVEEFEQGKLQATCSLDKSEVSQSREEVLQAFKKARVPGYRPGKASVEAIKVYYKNSIDEAVKRALAEKAYHDFLFEKEVKPLGQPQLGPMYLTDKGFVCTFSVYQQPAFELANYKGLEIPQPHTPSTVEELVEARLQELRVVYGEMSPFSSEDFLQQNNRAIINYTAKINNIEIPELSVQGEIVEVGKSNVKDFDSNLFGMKEGDTRTFVINVPEGNRKYAGESIEFTVTLVSATKILPHPLDDTLATKVQKNDLVELRNYLTSVAQAQQTLQNRSKLVSWVSNYLVEQHQFTVPDWLVLNEARYLAASKNKQWDVLADSEKEEFLSQAEKNTKLSLILDKIRSNEPEAQLSDQEAIASIEQNLLANIPANKRQESLQQLLQSNQGMSLIARIRDEHVLNFIITQAKIVE